MGDEGEAAEESPLLGEFLKEADESERKITRTGTLWTAAAHVITAVIGSGVLSLGWSVAQMGWAGGPIAMLFFAGVTLVQSTLLADCYRSPDPEYGRIRNRSYMDAIKLNLGEGSLWVCGFFQHTGLFGCAVAYTITAATSMRKVMKWMGANDVWCGWIDQCISNAKVAVLVNGSPTKWFKTSRGLRQGDPLSPYLFLLVAEGLAGLISKATNSMLLRGIGPSTQASTAIIQYADDTIFFCEAKKRHVDNLLFIWQIFEWASGLKINKAKSELIYIGSCSGRGERLAARLGCRLGSFPFRYLGLPLTNRSLRKEEWWPVVERVGRRVEGWQAKLLSLGGRLVLVNSVLSNLPIYFLSVFRAPKWVLKRLDGLRRAFFWKGRTEISGGHCLVSWKTICRSKSDGGLGVINLQSLNIALLVKWWWKFLASDNHQWGNLISSIYYRRRKPLAEGASFKPFSQWWRNVLALRAVFKCGIEFSLGDGRLINFWSDIWLGHASLRTCFPTLANEVSSLGRRVSECFGPNGWKWDVILRGSHPAGQPGRDITDQIRTMLSTTSTSSTSSDTVKWRWSASEDFSVNSTYKFLQFGGVHVTSFRKLWKIPIPLKVKVFIWMVLRCKVLTKDNLSKRGWSGDPVCVMCSAANETADHLFVSCKTTRDLTLCRAADKKRFASCNLVGDVWEEGCLRGTFGRFGLVVLASLWWSIWLERNRRIFQREKRSSSVLLSLSRSFYSDWVAFC